MAKLKLEYMWLDGYCPIANLRSKAKIVELDDYSGGLDRLHQWNFVGSSTQQAEGANPADPDQIEGVGL
jgi:glutamine synthetase